MEELPFKKVDLYSHEGYMFNSLLTNEYEKIMNFYKHDFELYKFQRFAANYFQPNSNFRSILLFFDTGTGKTVTTVSIINNISRFAGVINLLIMTPAAMKSSWVNSMN